MESHEMLQEVFQKCSAKQIAGSLGLSLSMIYKWAEPDDGGGSGAANPLDRIEALVRCTHDTRIVHWICERAGGFFIKNPKATWPHPIHLMPATNQIVQEFARALGQNDSNLSGLGPLKALRGKLPLTICALHNK